MTHVRRQLAVLCCALICALIAGCTIVSPSNSDENIEFGDDYDIRESDPATGEPAGPMISDGQLSVTVSYGGGCAEHEFELATRVTSDTARVWLTHDGNGDVCEAYLTETLVVPLPENVLRAPVRALLDPDGGAFEL